jgi:DNA polymerase-3 subunit gamma/tau
LKSLEEPPPHVIFMMATTELEKIPDTVRSRAQVYEFRTISTKAIADQLRRIVQAEQIVIPDDALLLIARDADGSMRDAQSKLDQVLAFTGSTVTGDDVATVLGLVGRDLLLDTVQAVADEDAPAAFALASRAVDMGYDLRLVCRELSRVVRDLLVLNVDPTRATDPEIAGESERDRVIALAARFSREDLLRSFDVLTNAEFDIRAAAQPRYHLEMALLRWMHLRKLMPIEDIIAAVKSGAGPGTGAGPAAGSFTRARVAPPVRPAAPLPRPIARPAELSQPARAARPVVAAAPKASPVAVPPPPAGGAGMGQSAPAEGPAESASADGAPPADFKDAFLAEIRKSKFVFYNTVVAQAQKIEVTANRVTFSFSSSQGALRQNCEQNRAWLETTAAASAGRRISVVSQTDASPSQSPASGTSSPTSPAMPSASAPDAANAEAVAAQAAATRKTDLREQALADAGVQAMLEVFPAEIRDVEEM